MGGFFKRFKDEMSYLKNKNWTLSEIGKFWDNLDEYDDINSKIYPSFQAENIRMDFRIWEIGFSETIIHHTEEIHFPVR